MRNLLSVVILWLFPLIVHCCPLALESFKIVDMSHTLDKDSIRFPVNPPFNFSTIFRGMSEDNSYWLELNKFDTPEHITTHLDAPSHFSNSSKNWKVHEIPADRLVGSGVVIDVRRQVAKNADYRLHISDLLQWERRYGMIPSGAIVFMWSGWDVRYPNKVLTFNTPTPDIESTFHFPGFHPDAASWLVNARSVGMLGVDTPSTDYGQSSHFEVHQIISKANVMGLENVNNLGFIPASGSFIVAAPVKLLNGSGGPVRLLAFYNRQKHENLL